MRREGPRQRAASCCSNSIVSAPMAAPSSGEDSFSFIRNLQKDRGHPTLFSVREYRASRKNQPVTPTPRSRMVPSPRYTPPGPEGNAPQDPVTPRRAEAPASQSAAPPWSGGSRCGGRASRIGHVVDAEAPTPRRERTRRVVPRSAQLELNGGVPKESSEYARPRHAWARPRDR